MKYYIFVCLQYEGWQDPVEMSVRDSVEKYINELANRTDIIEFRVMYGMQLQVIPVEVVKAYKLQGH